MRLFNPARAVSLALGCCFAAALAAASAAAGETIRPGYWESHNRVDFPGLPASTDRRCITPAQVAKYVEGPSNHIYHCTYPEHSAADGLLSFRGRCVDKKGRAYPIAGHGTYSPDTLDMTAAVRIFGIKVVASTHARRIGDVCPPTAPAAKPG